MTNPQAELRRQLMNALYHDDFSTVDSFDETILGLLDIATQAGYVFEKSNNLELKRLLLKFVFESLTLTEGKLTYQLRFPFNEFVNSKILVTQATK